MQAVTNKYGMNCLIQFEDFANANAFRLLNKYRNRYCTFNDDIQGTASVAIAGIFAALRITKNKLSDNTNMFACAFLVSQGRSHLNHEKEMFAHDHPTVKTLEEVVQTIKPTAIIGAFTHQILKDMGTFNEKPIGRAIFASGSPFPKVTLSDGQTFFPGQGNNAYVFPGVALGVIACGTIAEEVTEEHLAEGRLYPPLSSIRDVVDYAYKHNLASWYPEPEDKEAFVKNLIYSPDYDSFVIDSYQWPQEAMKTQNI
ncbi:NADP-dependent malic enzyme [Ophiophagus hannah]|uniref:Malic enzyme n=1 Tax=Ophiophagus hannah TaxID=8665 RepID=V8NGN6_OPHHA|nr:NADP-dependent malic enzyme [Ophiophagus hannah]